MAETTVVSARVDKETSALLDRIAVAQSRSRAWIVARLIERGARQEAEFLDFLKQGIDDLDAGRVISHDELVERIRARARARRAA